MPHQIMFREHYGANEQEVVYVKPPGQRSILLLHSTFPQSVTRSLFSYLKNFFRVVFLPQGYPESVSKDYFSYQLWDTVQAFSSTLNGTLTTQAIMKGVGVGDQAATPLAASITWILKDGSGNIGRILFAWWKGLPYFMGYSTALLCTATVMKSIVGVAGGATRAAITQHQAIRENMADVSAKDGSQETCVNLLASLVGVYLLTSVEQKEYVWLLFVLFTFVHLYANYKAVKALTMSSLNPARLNIIIKTYLDTRSVLHPDIVNRRESVFLGKGLSAKDICGYNITIGESLSSPVCNSSITAEQTTVLQHLYGGCGYMLLLLKKPKKIYIALEQGISSNSSTIVKAYFHAVILGIATNTITHGVTTMGPFSDKGTKPSVLKNLEIHIRDSYDPTSLDLAQNSILGSATQSWSLFHAIIASLALNTEESDPFLSCLQSSGWTTGGQHLGSDEWRLTWPSSLKERSSLTSIKT